MARRRPTEPTINPARGIALVVGAVVIGLLLLRNGLDTSEAVTSKGGEPTADAGSDKGSDGDGGGSTTTTAATVDAGRPAGEISAIVLNGTSVTGAAGKYSDALGALGYQMAEPATSAPGAKTATTQVFFTPGFDKEAVTMAAALGLPATVALPMPATPPGDIGTANIAVVIGDDIASLTPSTVANTTTTAAN
jgi:hypothetical protein